MHVSPASTLVQLGAPLGADMKIGDLAKRTGKTQRALRLYEELGLLAPDTRTTGGFRLYDARAVERVSFIAKLQDLGFTLTAIQHLVSAADGAALPKAAMARVRALYAAKQTQVQQHIERLNTLKDELASSLNYLETCAAACTQEHTVGTSGCGSCGAHGDVKAPSLVEGTRT